MYYVHMYLTLAYTYYYYTYIILYYTTTMVTIKGGKRDARLAAQRGEVPKSLEEPKVDPPKVEEDEEPVDLKEADVVFYKEEEEAVKEHLDEED